MGTATFHVAQGALSAPAFFIPNISRGLLASWEADVDLAGLADGADVMQWAASLGSAKATLGRLNYRSGGSTITMDADGCNGYPCVDFGGSAQLNGFANAGDAALDSAFSIYSYALLFRFKSVDDFVAQGTSRALTDRGRTNGVSMQGTLIRPSAGGAIYTGVGGGVNAGAVTDLTGWMAVIVVVDGTESKIKINGRAPLVTTLNEGGTVKLRAPGIGPAPGGLAVAGMRIWDRALSDDEMNAKIAEWREKYGLTL